MYQSLFNSILGSGVAALKLLKPETDTPADKGREPSATVGGTQVNEQAPQTPVTPGNGEIAERQSFDAMKERLDTLEKQKAAFKERVAKINALYTEVDDNGE